MRAKRITDAWAEQKVVREIMMFLHTNGVGTARAVRIYKTYGAYAIQLISENPYRLARDIRGIGFRTADQIAAKLGIEKTALIRVRAGISFALAEAMEDGHCGLPTDELIPLAQKLIEVSPELVETAIGLELQDGRCPRSSGPGSPGNSRDVAGLPDRGTTGARGAKPPDWPPDVRTKQTASLERYVMALLTRFPEEAARADLAPTDLDDPDLRALLIELRSGKHSTSDLPAQLAATAAALSASALELGDEVEPGREIERAALRLREQNLRRRFEDARARLARGEGGGAGALDGEVAQLASELDELMKRRERSTVLQAADLEQRIE